MENQSYIEVNLKHLINNYKQIKKETNKNVIAVVKDNAYGHGLIPVCNELSKNNVFMIAVSNISEAILIRKSTIFTPILLLGRCDNISLLYTYKITLSITSMEQLNHIKDTSIPLSIHLKIDTGMHRLGLEEDDILKALEIIKNSKLKLKGIYTHFCDKNNNKQIKIFKRIIDKIPFSKKLTIHAEASSYLHQKLNFTNAVRTGLALYGYSSKLKLQPCLKLFSPVIRIQKVIKNTFVGYDYLEKADDNGYIITIPFGYAHGLSRLKKLLFFYEGETLYQIGKTCMDMCMLFSKKYIKPLSKIEIISENNTLNLLQYNTDNMYYILSSLSPLINRKYIY